MAILHDVGFGLSRVFGCALLNTLTCECDQELSTSFAAWHESVGCRAQSAANKHAASDFWRRRQLAMAFGMLAEHASKIVRLRKVTRVCKVFRGSQ